MGFAADLKKLCDKAGDKSESVVRNVALQLQTQMVERSPVDTGRFKNNWMPGIGQANTATTEQADKTGAGAIGRTQATLAGWKPGQTIWLTNSLPYAMRLENGWSQQAPSGMVRLAVQNVGQAVSTAARGIK